MIPNKNSDEMILGDEPMIQLDINAYYRGIIPMNQGKKYRERSGNGGDIRKEYREER